MIDATGEESGEKSECEGMEASSHSPAQGKLFNFTDEQVVGHAIEMLLAGYETTSNTLAYTSYLLALHPDIQEKLQSEIDSYFSEKPVSQYYHLIISYHCVYIQLC